RNRGSRAQRDAIECAAVLPERRLAFGAAVDVIEHDPRQSPFRRLSKIFDADDTMGGESSIAHASMSWPPRTRRPQSQIDLSVFCELCGQLVDRAELVGRARLTRVFAVLPFGWVRTATEAARAITGQSHFACALDQLPDDGHQRRFRQPAPVDDAN